MKIVKNSLTQEVVEKDPIVSITSNLITSDREVIITADDNLYQVKREELDPLPASLVTATGDVVITTDDEVYQVVK